MINQKQIDWVQVTAEASDFRGQDNVVQMLIPNCARGYYTPEEARIMGQKFFDAAIEAEKNEKIHPIEAAEIRRAAGAAWWCHNCDFVTYGERVAELHDEMPGHRTTENKDEAGDGRTSWPENV